MKRVIWTDKNGLRRCSQLRDTDDSSNPSIGIPIEPPPIDTILEDAKLEMRNALVDAGLFTWNDVMIQQIALSVIVKKIIHTKLVMAYRQGERNGE